MQGKPFLTIKLPRVGAGQEPTHWSSAFGFHSKMFAVPSELLVLPAMKCLLGKEGLLRAHLRIPSAAEAIWLSCSKVLGGWRKDKEMFAHRQPDPSSCAGKGP